MVGLNAKSPEACSAFVKREQREGGVAILAAGDRKGAARALRAAASLLAAAVVFGGLHFLPFMNVSVWILIPLVLLFLGILWSAAMKAKDVSQLYAQPIEAFVSSSTLQVRYGRSRRPRFSVPMEDIRRFHLATSSGGAESIESLAHVVIEIGRRDFLTIAHRDWDVAHAITASIRDEIAAVAGVELPDIVESELDALLDRSIRRPRGTRIRRVRRDGALQIFVPAHVSRIRLVLEWTLASLLVAAGFGLFVVAVWATLKYEILIAITLALLGVIVVGSGIALSVSSWRWRKSALTLTVRDGVLTIEDTSPILNKGRVIHVDDIVSINAVGTLDADDRVMQRALVLAHFERERIQKTKLMQLCSDDEVEWVASELRRATRGGRSH